MSRNEEHRFYQKTFLGWAAATATEEFPGRAIPSHPGMKYPVRANPSLRQGPNLSRQPYTILGSSILAERVVKGTTYYLTPWGFILGKDGHGHSMSYWETTPWGVILGQDGHGHSMSYWETTLWGVILGQDGHGHSMSYWVTTPPPYDRMEYSYDHTEYLILFYFFKIIKFN